MKPTDSLPWPKDKDGNHIEIGKFYYGEDSKIWKVLDIRLAKFPYIVYGMSKDSSSNPVYRDLMPKWLIKKSQDNWYKTVETWEDEHGLTYELYGDLAIKSYLGGLLIKQRSNKVIGCSK